MQVKRKYFGLKIYWIRHVTRSTTGSPQVIRDLGPTTTCATTQPPPVVRGKSTREGRAEPSRAERKMINQREDQQKGDQPVQSAPERISDRIVSSKTPELVDDDYPMNTAS